MGSHWGRNVGNMRPKTKRREASLFDFGWKNSVDWIALWGIVWNDSWDLCNQEKGSMVFEDL